MGLLTEGTPLDYAAIHAMAARLRRRAVRQLVRRFKAVERVQGDKELWGDEVEYTLVQFGPGRRVKALLGATALLRRVENAGGSDCAEWQPEYAAFMVEGVPARPYNGLKDCVWRVESEMAARRRQIDAVLGDGQRIMSLAHFPLIGTPQFTHPPLAEPDSATCISQSAMFPDGATNCDYAHFPTVTKVITERRGRPVHASLPVFVDERTARPFVDDLDGRQAVGHHASASVKEDHVLLDAMPFGPSCCSLQTTFGCASLDSMLWLRDQLLPFAPIALALTAAAPIFRGFLCDTDTRWDVLRQCLDDRTASERAGNKSYTGAGRVTTSRCDSVDSYCSRGLEAHNDIALPFDRHAYDQLLLGDVRPDGFAEAMAHLLIREPLQVFEESLEHLDDDDDSVEMFEGIHLFHWRTVRTKLPPADRSSGWKVEFRPMEVQPTDYQNAAFAVFTFLVAKAIGERRLSMEMPISKVFDNMSRACRRDAATAGRFWWPRSVATASRLESDGSESDLVEMSMEQVLGGDGGILGVVEQCLLDKESECEISASERRVLLGYVDFVRRRGDGSAPTPARWQRDYVRSHAEYKGDSVVPPGVVHDMLCDLHRIDDDSE